MLPCTCAATVQGNALPMRVARASGRKGGDNELDLVLDGLLLLLHFGLQKRHRRRETVMTELE
jgi:hypothetical protein